MEAPSSFSAVILNTDEPEACGTAIRVPNVNTDHGDFTLIVTSGDVGAFNSDTSWGLGYNSGQLMAGVPSMFLSFESDWDNGSGPGVEFHLVHHSPAGVAYRPLTMRIENGSSFTAFGIAVDKLNFFDAQTNTNQAMIWLASPTTGQLMLNKGTIVKHNANNVPWLLQSNAEGNNSISLIGADSKDRVSLGPQGTLAVVAGGRLQFTDSTCELSSDGHGVISQRDLTVQTNPQEFRVYGNVATTKYLSLKHDGTNSTIGPNSGVLNFPSALRFESAGAFAGGDKYLVIDAAGNVHVSAIGPAS